MSERKAQLIQRLTEKGQETLALFSSLMPEQWETQVYTDGPAWNVRHIFCHIISAERGFIQVIHNILEGGEGAPEDFVIDDFNAQEVAAMEGIPPAELLAWFEAARAELLTLVENLDESDLDCQGRHPAFGITTVEQFIKGIYRHNMIHQRDIRQVLGLL